jgi:hypothetical protein
VDATGSADDREAALWRLSVLESRRASADAFTWAVPGLAVAGQAFLLSIVLRADISDLGRALAALAGLLASAAATHLYTRQTSFVDLYEAFIDMERTRIGLPGVRFQHLREAAADFAPDSDYVQRRWTKFAIIPGRLGRSTDVWIAALIGFVIIDSFLLIYSIAALAGADPDWL